jgi:site-specific DNA-methyltransferase (adenine-specific)
MSKQSKKDQAKPEMILVEIAKVIPYPGNPRKIGPQAVAAVAGSIKEFGFKSPIIVDRDFVVINGHTRLLAAQSLGLAHVPVIVASDLTPQQVKAFRLADNRVAEFSEWDLDFLTSEIEGVEDVDLDFADMDSLVAELEESKASGEQKETKNKEIDPDAFELGHTCPKCGFQFNDHKGTDDSTENSEDAARQDCGQ